MNSNPEPTAEATRPAMSLAARLMNVFADPGEVFESVKNGKPSIANWLVPALISSLAGAVSVIVIFSQPAITQKIHEQQVSAMDKQVKDGKMTQAQADQALAIMDKYAGPAMMKISGSVGAVVVSFLHVFWWAFVLWLMAALILKTKIPFMKAAEVGGLTLMILVLGALITTLLTVITGKLGVTAGPALLIPDYDVSKKTHVLLAVLNVFTFWKIGVLACGLSHLAGVSFGRALLVAGIYALALALILVLTGLGQFAL